MPRTRTHSTVYTTIYPLEDAGAEFAGSMEFTALDDERVMVTMPNGERHIYSSARLLETVKLVTE